jgi:3,4-dihydroxy-2-butanone 4-phosphate synthase
MTLRLDSIERAIADIKSGKAVVVIDDEDRENEGDIIFAAELATPELLAFMVRYTSGYICVPMTEADADRLDLPPMFHTNQDRRGTAYTVTVDAREGVTTGISAHDRAHTIRLLADPASRCGPRTAASCAGPGTPRRPSTWPCSPGCTRPASSARSSARRTRPGWRGPRSCGSSPTSTTWR